MSVTVKNPVIKQKFARLKKPPIKEALNAIKDDNVRRTTQKGWNRFQSGIEIKQDTDTKGRVFVNQKGNPSNNKIGAWLQYGRGWVYPVKAQVLRWITKAGNVVFSKWARPTKPQPWWGLYETAKVKVRQILKKFYGKI